MLLINISSCNYCCQISQMPGILPMSVYCQFLSTSIPVSSPLIKSCLICWSILCATPAPWFNSEIHFIGCFLWCLLAPAVLNWFGKTLRWRFACRKLEEQRKHNWTDEEVELGCSCNKGLCQPTESSRIGMVLQCCLEPSELGLCTACLNSHWHGLFMEVEDNSWTATQLH